MGVLRYAWLLRPTRSKGWLQGAGIPQPGSCSLLTWPSRVPRAWAVSELPVAEDKPGTTWATHLPGSQDYSYNASYMHKKPNPQMGMCFAVWAVGLPNVSGREIWPSILLATKRSSSQAVVSPMMHLTRAYYQAVF